MNKKLIGIIGGKGRMGKYFADFFRKNGYEVIISEKGTKLSNLQLAKKADVVIVSVPIGVTEKVIDQVAPYVKKSGLLMDMTSLKEMPMKAMEKAKASYLGFHPLFGPFCSAEGQIAVLCKGRGAKWHKWLKEILENNKLDVYDLTASQHDNLMAYVQALSHFTEIVLADTLRKSGINMKDFLKYQSPSYRLKLDMMGRILNQDPNLYAQIQIQNPKGIKAIQAFLKSTEKWTNLVKDKNVEKFEKNFKKASKYLGSYKRVAMEESDMFIEQMNRKKLLTKEKFKNIKPDRSYGLAALGPDNSFSSLAAKRYTQGQKIWYTDTITDVFDLVGKGLLKKGLVPIANKLSGTVVETIQNLFESNLKIQESFRMPIHHFLVTLNKVPKKEIKTIYSHAQPINQCRKYLKKHFPKAIYASMPSTTSALNKVISENLSDAAVICSRQAAESFNMFVLGKNIEDFKSNSTRFVVIGKKELPFKKGASYRTTIAFHFSADAPGTLHEVLGQFSKARVNMTKIESQANPIVPGGHLFYIDFEGHPQHSNVKKMLPKIQKHVAVFKVLGSFES